MYSMKSFAHVWGDKKWKKGWPDGYFDGFGKREFLLQYETFLMLNNKKILEYFFLLNR